VIIQLYWKSTGYGIRMGAKPGSITSESKVAVGELYPEIVTVWLLQGVNMSAFKAKGYEGQTFTSALMLSTLKPELYE
jgi:hypothetical protein